ncbi:hypothetical protein [Streptomyces lavendulae]|uniref:hypothetical protein n=1 Tax=Streptomyces lavendulae TaxID=1914 RepID=UPI003810854C
MLLAAVSLVLFLPPTAAQAATYCPTREDKPNRVFEHGCRLDRGWYITSRTDTVRLVMQSDGNLVVRDSANNPLWASGTYGYFPALQDDGNMVRSGARRCPGC